MSSQTKVGLLFLFAGLSVAVFVSFIGKFSLFGSYKRVVVAYNFVGGLEEGSHVRLMGVKVGKVERVEFRPDYVDENGKEVKLHIHIRVNEKAWPVIREDSHYFINMAGIIGEKYLEISPGTNSKAEIVEGSIQRGTDPPRVDQLISQGYALAGKILAVVEDNESSVTGTIGTINDLVKSLNKVLVTVDGLMTNKEYNGVVERFNILSREMTTLLKDVNQGNLRSMLISMKKLMKKLEKVEEKEIRQFLQEEGIKARVAL